MKKTWYSIKASASAPDTADIAIHDEIGMWGISARNFIADLKALGPVRQINLSLHSPGGEVLDGLAIYNVLDRHPAHITATIEGLAASMASVIAMAADELVMPENAFLMIHNPWGVAIGDAQDMQDTAELLNKMRETAVNAYQSKTGLSREEIIALMDAETWMTGSEALDKGFVDSVLQPVAMAALSAFDTRRFSKMPAALTQTVTRSHEGEIIYQSPQTMMQMSKKIIESFAASTDTDPVEPIAPAADAPTDAAPAPASDAAPTDPVEPPAPAVEEAPVEEPQGFVAKPLAGLRSLLPGAAAQVDPPSAELSDLRTRLGATEAKLTAAEAELAILRPKAQERDELETALAALQAQAKSASVQAAEIAASAGFRETAENQLPAIRNGEAGSILDQFNAITDPGERSKFYKQHKDALRAARISLQAKAA